MITVIKFDKEGNKIQEKKIEEKPLTFPKAPGMQFFMSFQCHLVDRSKYLSTLSILGT